MRTDPEFLNDILLAIDSIQEALARKKAGTADERILRGAVLYEITIIGEASNRLTRKLRSKYPEVPWNGVRGMRNRVLHEYFGVDSQILWETVTTELEPLKQQIRAMLEREFPDFTPPAP